VAVFGFHGSYLRAERYGWQRWDGENSSGSTELKEIREREGECEREGIWNFGFGIFEKRKAEKRLSDLGVLGLR